MVGQAIRPSQFVLTYGVGSIIETSEGPVVIQDFERWGRIFGKGRSPGVEQFQIQGSSMASGLLDNGLVFRIPTNADIPKPDNEPIFVTIPFPGWALCVRHSRLYELHGGRTLCTECLAERYLDTVIKRQAIRFVRACPDGHLDDIDWFGLVHSTGSSPCNCRMYRWESRGSSLRNIIIGCEECGCSIRLSDVYNQTSRCTGRFAEKGSNFSTCDKKAKVVLRGSSSLRMPEIISVIPIPQNSSPLHVALDTRAMRMLLSTQTEWTKDQLIDRLRSIKEEAPDMHDPDLLDQVLRASDERVREVIIDMKRSIRSRPATMDEIRARELRALREAAEFGQPPDPESEDPEFQVKVQDVRDSVPFHSHQLRVTPIERLSIIMIQKGYRRLDTQNSVVPTFYYDGNEKWFPGVKLKGEGIFIDSGKTPFNIESQDWLRVFNQSKDWRDHPLAVWWHTLSHRIISGLSKDSGYSSAAIRENVYMNIDTRTGISAGILLYTTQQGGDGSLGGLIALVPEFESILQTATRNINACSNDPLCSEEKIQLGKHNGAACYACLLLSETSCSQRNTYLDRNLLRDNL